MKIKQFRIKHFRSIVDTGWCNFSPDGITVLVGQNESGKTSILAALAKTLNDRSLSEDDCRIDNELPAVFLRLEATQQEITSSLDEFSPESGEVVRSHFEQQKELIEFKTSWTRSKDAKKPFNSAAEIIDEELSKKLSALPPVITPATSEDEDEDSGKKLKPPPRHITVRDLGWKIYVSGPVSVLFEEDSGLLPDRVDVIKNEEGNLVLSGKGAAAAENFLRIANVSLADLGADERVRKGILNRANTVVSRLLGEFWSQTIGNSQKIQLECSMHNYGTDSGEKSGSPHLAFWIKDGTNALYPRQRSQGVRWFISFFLQLASSEKDADSTLFLLDEPGANLHSNAQSDVLRFLNRIRNKVMIVYSTHTPGMVEHDKQYRVLAVQRDDNEDDSSTQVVDAHRLSSASKDTLSPLLMAMGADLSQHQAIKKQDNVLLEEISAHYYLKAFWLLTGSKQAAHFIAATGTGNMEPLANMFLGWGLGFIAVMDDENSGRGVYNRMKRLFCGDNDEKAKAMLYKIKGCAGIEDIFSISDFKKLVLAEPGQAYEVSNSQFVKDTHRAKAVLAYNFLLGVERGDIKLKSLDVETTTSIRDLVNEIELRLRKVA